MTEHHHAVHWYQAESDGVTSWEFQYLPGGPEGRAKVWEWATQVGPATTCEGCFEVPLDLPSGVAAIRARAIGMEGNSEWGSPVGLPEPSSVLMLAIALILIAFIQIKRINRVGR